MNLTCMFGGLSIHLSASISRRRAHRESVAEPAVLVVPPRPVPEPLPPSSPLSASPSQVFVLRSAGRGSYYLSNPAASALGHVLNGEYDFVVRDDRPNIVYVGIRRESLAGTSLPALAVDGPLALAFGADMLLAGTLEFKYGRLVRWTNTALARPVFTIDGPGCSPAVQALLPLSLFVAREWLQ